MEKLSENQDISDVEQLDNVLATALPTGFIIHKYYQHNFILDFILHSISSSGLNALNLNAKNLAPAIVLSRYITAEKILTSKADISALPFGGFKQIVELGCGFSSHSLNHLQKNFIQVDFDKIIDIRKQALQANNLSIDNLIDGNILERDTWRQIAIKISSENGPVAILAEGLMMYLDIEQKNF